MNPNLRLFNDLIIIPYFWILWSLAVSIALILYFVRVKKRQLEFDTSWNFAILLLVSSLLGARALHVLYEEPQYYLDYPWQIINILNGGMVFYGGLLAIILTTFSYFKVLRLSPWIWLDAIAPSISVGYIIGRIGCFINGCCYGKVCELPWAIHQRHPTQIYASLLELLLVLLILFVEKLSLLKTKGLIFCLWLFLHSSARLFVEFFRDDPRGPNISDLSLSTWISLILLTSSVGIGLSLVKKK